jgi:hypothetical protein
VGPKAVLDAVSERNIFCPCRASNPGRPTRSLVAILTELKQKLPSALECIMKASYSKGRDFDYLFRDQLRFFAFCTQYIQASALIVLSNSLDCFRSIDLQFNIYSLSIIRGIALGYGLDDPGF